MGVYIKGMKMPKGCASCPLYNDECFGAYKCEAAQSWGSDTERASGCPLVPVPKHGRLIDADALEYEEAYLNGHYELGDVEIVTRKDIESAPTVIPASEEGE